MICAMSLHASIGARYWGLVLLLVGASVGLSVGASRLERFPGDLPITEWVQSISMPLFDEVMRGVSGVGWWLPASIITVCAGLALVVLRRGSDAALLVVLVSVSSGANWVVKQIVASPRPDSAMLEVREELTSYGFPSGHVLFAVVCFGALAILLSGVGGRYTGLRKAMQAGLILLVVAMATSRVYLGVHWPSDVMGAVAMGGVYLVVLVWSRGRLQEGGGVIKSARSPCSETFA